MKQWHNDLAESLALDGVWQFSLRGDSGPIRVPGTWEAQGYARRVDGPAEFQRGVTVPAEWAGRRVHLQFDAVSYHADVQVNGVDVGTHTGSWTPFALDVTDAIRPGEENTIRLVVWKQGERFPLRESLAGFLPDVAVMFGGIWQSARLVAFDGPALGGLAISANPDSGKVFVAALADGADGLSATVRIYDDAGKPVAEAGGPLVEGEFAGWLSVPEPRLWSPADPALYSAELALHAGDRAVARMSRRFGFRELSAAGDQLLFNGEPVFLRGALNWGWYPDILCPAPDEATIRDEFRRIRELGCNLMKLCLYVPSPRYFEIADEEGMYLWLELPLWLPEVTPRLKAQARTEYADIVAEAQRHPSVILYSLGCELEANVETDWLEELNGIVRRGTRGALVCDNSGSGEAYGCLADLADFNDYHFYADLHYFDPLVDHFHRDWRAPRPTIFGEFCDADDYRDLDEVIAAFGGEEPWWLAEQNPIHPLSKVAYVEQRARMSRIDVGMSDRELQAFSRQQSLVMRKAILEKVRARDGMGGYVITSLRNTPLASSSLFDDLGRSKYGPATFRQFNADTVLLLGRGRARRWLRSGDHPAPAEPYAFAAGAPVTLDLIASHAGPPLPGGELAWEVFRGDGTALDGGTLALRGPLAGGRPQSLARIAFDTPDIGRAETLRFSLALRAGAVDVRNAWPLWIFPAVTAWPEEIVLLDPAGSLTGLDDLAAAARRVTRPDGATRVVIASTLNGDTLAFLREGGAVLLLQQGDGPLPAQGLPFWRNSVLFIGDHPAMDAFPHAGFVDLQFYGLASEWALITERAVADLPEAGAPRPLLRRLSTNQFTLADYLVEIPVGRGRLIASTLRFQGGQGDQPFGLRDHLAGQWLLWHLLRYLGATTDA